MNPTRMPPAAPAGVCVLLLALAAPAAAQNPYYPATPASPVPSSPPQAPEDRSLTTAPGARDYGPPSGRMSSDYGLLTPILRRIQLPQASGEIRQPPTDAAVIVVRVPADCGDVLFDGQRTYTAGTTRTFVTPILPDGEPAHYTVAIRWEGEGAAKEREIEAPAGRITVVDFTRPADK